MKILAEPHENYANIRFVFYAAVAAAAVYSHIIILYFCPSLDICSEAAAHFINHHFG